MAITGKEIRSKEPFYTTSDNIEVDEANAVTNKDNQYSNKQKAELPRGVNQYENSDGDVVNTQSPDLPESEINSYHLLRVKSVGDNNYPINDTESAARPELYRNVKALDLINNPRGASLYKPEDFLYCSKYGQIQNNRLITLRRFPFPVFDDIFTDIQTEPDIARALTFSTQETNKLSELLNFTVGLRYKELKSNIEQANMLGPDNGINGWARNVLQFVDPAFGQQALDQKIRLGYDPLHDQNKVHGPVDVIDAMFIRDIGLNFDQSIKLTFEYEMRSINGVNQKTAMLDLLANIFLLTTNDAKFWGGARYWVGPRPTKYLKNLKFLSPKDFDTFLNGATKEFKSFIGGISGAGGAKNVVSTLKTVAENALNLSLGKMLDKIGRPGIPVMNSLLTGLPTGEWHLTVGNPMNPILCIGDLILDSSTISFGDELGYDDFPTKLMVECNLKHNKPKGRAEIESMFNAGRGRIYLKPEAPFANAGQTSRTGKTEPRLTHDLIDTGVNDLFTQTLNKEAYVRTGKQFWSFSTDI